MAAKDILTSIPGMLWRFLVARKNIAVRTTFAIFFLMVWAVLSAMLLFLTLFQFAFLCLFARHNEAIKGFSHVLVTYHYRVLRYLTLNENLKPYPFSKFPDPIEPADDTDLSAPVPAAEPEKAETEKPSEPIIMGYEEEPKK